MVKIVFFDFSRTVAKGTGFGAGPIFIGRKKQYEVLYEKYKSKKINENDIVRDVVKLWKGIKAKGLRKIYSRIKLNPNVRQALRKLKKQNLKLALVSNIPTKLAGMYKNLCFDFISGTECEIKNKTFTGKVLKINANKFQAVKEICRDAKIKPNERIAVGDAIGDIGMFKAVGYENSIAYNANDEVKKYAKYHINNFNEIAKIV
jgi:HAD superfamily phosphoserine phosphatase-like hydrolase